MKYSGLYIALILLISVTLKANTVQIIPAVPSFGQELGRALGSGIGSGFQQGMQHNFYKRNNNCQEERDAKLLKKLIEDYHPSRHSECVLEILSSQVSNNLKGYTIDVLNQIHAEYVSIKEKNLNRKAK